jgi:hypothetical protein
MLLFWACSQKGISQPPYLLLSTEQRALRSWYTMQKVEFTEAGTSHRPNPYIVEQQEEDKEHYIDTMPVKRPLFYPILFPQTSLFSLLVYSELLLLPFNLSLRSGP